MKRQLVLITCLLAATSGFAAETQATLNIADAKGVGAAIGTVRIVETPYGLAFYPNLTGLPAGLHGFHVHG